MLVAEELYDLLETEGYRGDVMIEDRLDKKPGFRSVVYLIFLRNLSEIAGKLQGNFTIDIDSNFIKISVKLP